MALSANLKKMRRMSFSLLIVLSVAISSAFSTPLAAVNAISKPSVVLSDYRPNQSGVRYTIMFSTQEGPGTYISIYFLKYSDTGDVENGNVVNPSVTASQITIRTTEGQNYSSGGILDSSSARGVVSFLVPQEAQSSRDVTVTISESAGFGNGPAGKYRVRVVVNKETSTPADSDYYMLSNSKLQSVSVTVNPPYSGKNARYSIEAKTSNYDSSAFSSGDYVHVRFPSGTSLPSSVTQNSISIKYGSTEKFFSIVSFTVDSVTMEVPSGISVAKNSYFTVTFYESANISNPQVPKKYTLSVETRGSSGSIKDELTESSEYEITATSISNISVKVEPDQVGAQASYTISFKTSSSGNLSANSGEVHVKFPENSSFFVPPTIPASQVTVNDSVPYRVDVLGKELRIIVSQGIQAGSSVTVVIQSGAGIKNPTESNSYKLTVWTSSDPTQLESPVFTIGPSSIGNVKVTVTPQIASMQAMYIITFQTGSFGSLNQGDTIKVKFPQGTYVPAYISPEKVRINNQNASLVSISGTTVSITIPTLIPSGYSVAVQFALDSGIRNPSVPQSYKVAVSTSRETKEVESSLYEIIKGVTTSHSAIPQVPDGQNGYYISLPTIEIRASAPQGLSYTIYYKWDDAPSYEKYTSPIKPPEGVHTLSYYSTDSFGNNEQVHAHQFKVDTQKPSLVIASPEPGKTFFDKTVVISGKVEPNSSLSVSYGLITAPVQADAEGNFQYNFVFSSEGSITLVFIAKDEAGNMTQLELPLKYIYQRNIMLVVGKRSAYVNGVETALNAAPFIQKGRVLVPIRFISETLGADVKWDEIFKIVTISLGNRVVRLQVGNLTADLNGKATMLDVAPVVKDGTTFVPVRFVSEAFGASVEWDAAHGIVIIVYPGK